MVFIIKTHQGPHGKVLVVSDKEILGKKFEEGKLQLDLTKEFYLGEEADEEKIKELLPSIYILHLTGEKTINLFLKLNLVDRERILKVNGIPHAEASLVEN